MIMWQIKHVFWTCMRSPDFLKREGGKISQENLFILNSMHCHHILWAAFSKASMHFRGMSSLHVHYLWCTSAQPNMLVRVPFSVHASEPERARFGHVLHCASLGAFQNEVQANIVFSGVHGVHLQALFVLCLVGSTCTYICHGVTSSRERPLLFSASRELFCSARSS